MNYNFSFIVARAYHFHYFYLFFVSPKYNILIIVIIYDKLINNMDINQSFQYILLRCNNTKCINLLSPIDMLDI